jgi:hypothetical protein
MRGNSTRQQRAMSMPLNGGGDGLPYLVGIKRESFRGSSFKAKGRRSPQNTLFTPQTQVPELVD